MNIQNRQVEAYNVFTTQNERTGSQRVAPPPRRAEGFDTPVNTSSGTNLSENPVDLNRFEAFQDLLKNKLSTPAVPQNLEQESLGRSINTIAEEIRNGTYVVDSSATAIRLNNLELLLR